MSLPLSIIWGTRINFQQKVGLVIVFCFGFLIIAVAIVRAVMITGRAYSDQAALAIWSIAESSICKSTPTLDVQLKYTNYRKAMIVGCLPPFRAILSTGPNSIQYRYGLGNSNLTDYPNFPLSKPRSTTGNWSEDPLPTHDQQQYNNMEFEMHTPQDVHVNGGQGGGSSNATTNMRRGDLQIQMVQEFVSFPFRGTGVACSELIFRL